MPQTAAVHNTTLVVADLAATREGAKLAFSNVDYSINHGKPDEKIILKGVCACMFACA